MTNVKNGKIDYLFSTLSSEIRSKIKFDNISLYSVTPQETSMQIAQILNRYGDIVTDATACIGSDTISLCKYFKHVNSIELDPKRCEFLKYNCLELLKIKNLCVYNKNCLHILPHIKQDIVYIDAPFGGPSYKDKKLIMLYLDSIPIWSICNVVNNYCKYIALKLPVNFNYEIFFSNCNLDMVILDKSLKKLHLLILKTN